MKKSIKFLAVLMSAAVLLQTGSLQAAASESAPDVSLTEGKITYSTSGGLFMTATETTYNVWSPAGVTPYYGVALSLENAGSEVNVEITNENSFDQTLRFNFVTTTGTYALENKTVVAGKNTINLQASSIDDFSGEITALEVIGDAFFCLNGVIVVNGVENAAGEEIWTPGEDGYTEIKNDAVSSSVYLVDKNRLQGSNLASGSWYPVTFKTATDMSDCEGFSFYIDTTIEGKDVYFNKYIQELRAESADGIGEKWYAPDEGAYNCYPETGAPFVMTGNLIPAYFKGRVVVPFNTFQIPDWAETYNGTLDLNNTDGQIGFTFDGSRGDFIIGLSGFSLEEKVGVIENVSVTQGDITFIDDMSSYTDSTTANYSWRTNWSLASPCTVELVQNPEPSVGAIGNALRITPLDAPKNPEPDPATGNSTPTGFTALELFPSGGSFDISGSTGITFFVKNEKNSPFYLNCEFDIMQEGYRQRWAVKQYGRYTLYDTVTGTQKLFNAFSGIYVPANFCGWVRIDYSQFTNPSWESVAGDFNTDSGLVYFVINIETLRFSGHTFIFDSLGVYSEKTEVKTQFYTPEKDIVSAIGGTAQ
ncbi:MAG: hypothetical protein IJY62_02580 [Clostridia bacterium]|nr:hypothetical protein [Clostridia bacterium]